MNLGALAGPEAGLDADAAATPISGLAADSREVKPGYLFAGLPGVNTDGTRFIADALARGAVAILSQDPVDAGAAVIVDPDPRKRLAEIAARFFAKQPADVVAVTGTNGKTSVAAFVRQLWATTGISAASLGTIGVVSPKGTQVLRHTTPDPIELHGILATLADDGVTHLAIEASSHGLQQRRLDGVTLKAGAFTNISRDHLDYHASFEDYFRQKLRLFTELLPRGAVSVIDMDSEAGETVADKSRAAGLEVIGVGRRGDALRLVSAEIDGFAQVLGIEHGGKLHSVRLPLVGDFQASNALVATGLAMATGISVDDALAGVAKLMGAHGRLDLAGTAAGGAPVFIDYAHTPDALAKAIDALRPYASKRLVVLFGCGGDRDQGKRPQMGQVATEKADIVIVTDDNPRHECPAAIRAAILEAAPGAIEIGDRKEAIAQAIAMLGEGDVLLVAGKGHETGQTVGDTVIPFSDHEAVSAVLTEEAGRD